MSLPFTPTAQVPGEPLLDHLSGNSGVGGVGVSTSLDCFTGIFDLEDVSVGTVD